MHGSEEEKHELHPMSRTHGELALPAVNGMVAAVCTQLFGGLEMKAPEHG